MDGNTKLENRDNITKLIIDLFEKLYSKKDWKCPSLENLEFATIGEERAAWLERGFEEDEVKAAVFDFGGIRRQGRKAFL